MRALETAGLTFAVRTDAATLRRSAKGSITGTLFVEVGGQAFPESGWSDFPVVVLGWWLRAVLALQKTNAPASCMFMDGPFECELMAAGPGSWALRLLESRADAVRVVRDGRVGSETVLVALRVAADAVIRSCKERGWSSADVDELHSARGALCD